MGISVNEKITLADSKVDKTKYGGRFVKNVSASFGNTVHHTFTHIPHPMHNSSDMEAILLFGVTSIQSFPILTTGQDLLHSCLHRFGLHLSELTIAIRVSRSVSSIDFFGGMVVKYSPT